MKEATGELNLTVITVVAIAALMAFFYLVIWPNLKVSMALNTACNAAGSYSGTATDFYKSGTASTEGYIHCSAASSVVTCNYYDGSKDNSRVCK